MDTIRKTKIPVLSGGKKEITGEGVNLLHLFLFIGNGSVS